MSGVDSEVHVLAANVRNLSEKLDEMRDENREWRNKQLDIYKSLSGNQVAMANLSRRVAETDENVRIISERVSSFESIKWKSFGFLSCIVIIFEVLLKF